MATPALRVFAFLTRLDTSLFVFVSVFAPIYLGLGSAETAARIALPLLPICMCGFVLNNLHDVEKDRANHPERPLPREEVTGAFSAGLFLVLLAAGLVSLKLLIPAENVFPYVLLLVAMIAYNHVVAYLTPLKNFVVAAAGVLPVAIVASELPARFNAPQLMLATFLFLVCIEILSDIRDIRGDGPTLAKQLGVTSAARVAFAALALSDALLLFAAKSPLQLGATLTFVALDAIVAWFWFRGSDKRLLTRALRVQAVASLVYLI